MDENMTSLKTALLKNSSKPELVEIFGTEVYLRRMTAAEIIENEEVLNQAQIDGDARRAAELSVQVVVDCLVNHDGSAIAPEDKPTAAELLAVHDNVALLHAIKTVKEHSIGTLERAEKN